MKRILQIDGGGLRGIIPAVFLAALERRLGRPLWQCFDLISGTSTGAIIAGCLASGASAETVRDMYVDKGAGLFKRNWTFPVFSASKYDRRPLVDALRSIIGASGLDCMGQARTRFQAVSVDLCKDENIYFKSWKPECARLRISDAIQRSFSAAVYFGLTAVPEEGRVYADGGEGDANCSLRECIIEAYKLGWRDEGFYILSCGTGFVRDEQTFAEASKYGVIGQTQEYINLARRQAVRTQLAEAMTIKQVNPKFDFDRIDVQIEKRHDELDGLKFTSDYCRYGACEQIEFLNDGLVFKCLSNYHVI